MTRYSIYTVEELAADEMFRSWILDPNPEVSTLWANWLAENPEKRTLVNQAGALVLVVDDAFNQPIPEETVHEHIEEITRLAELSNNQRTTSFRERSVWRVAAALILVAGIGWLYVTRQTILVPFVVQNPELEAEEHMIVKTNQTNQEMTIFLSDNSVATLKNGSTLTYPTTFNREERKVFLTGEAFFDVTKNPKKPFLVFANETVTKVLGTSFRVKAFLGDNTVMIFVKTGKVSVYPMNEYERLSDKNNRTASGVVLNPNQQAVFIRDQNRLEKGIVSNPEMLSESSIAKELIFDDRPVSEVLQTLEDVYGINIVFDPEIVGNCVISAQFDEENLKQKMSVICQAIGASYEVVDGQIIINSKGCS